MDARTVAIDSKDLESGIEALSSAAQAFRLTRFERGAYHLLMFSVYVTAWTWITILFVAALEDQLTTDLEKIGQTLGVVAVLGICLVIVALVLNIPLAAKLYRERRRLKELGLASLSKSLWKERRRGRWIGRAFLWVPAIVLMILIPIAMADIISKGEEASTNEIFGSLFCVIVVALIVLSKYLRNQRERIDLAASADELKTALQRLQRGVSKSEKVSIPSELLEQAARIETAQIAKERKDAVLQSVPVGPSGYGITFDRTAAEQRQMLNVSDRLELEDLVAELSIGGPGTLKSPTGAVANPQEAIRRAESKDRRVEIEYVVDQASHGIRIVVIRHQSPSSAKGGSHA